MKKKLLKGCVGFAFATTLFFNTAATYAGYLSSQDFTTLSTAWNPGADTARNAAGSPAPGGATWSLLGAGTNDTTGNDAHGGNSTTAFTELLGQTQAEAIAYIDDVLDVWSLQSGFTNLGNVADSDASFGATNALGGHQGDIRVGAVFIDGAVGSNVLAHAFSPCTNGFCGPGGSIGGDLHVDNSNSWVDNASAGAGELDLFTVLLHEFGHALGLGHSSVAGSIMEATYAGARRTLTADDIAGIQTIYGPAAVPLPGGIILLLSALFSLGVVGKSKRSQQG